MTMKRWIRPLLVCCLFLSVVSAKSGLFAQSCTIWADAKYGNDYSNNGKSSMSAFQTLQHAAGVTTPGDVVCMNDSAPFTAPYSFVLAITTPGKPGHPITYTSSPGEYATIQMGDTNFAGIKIYTDPNSGSTGAYITIQNIQIIGNNASAGAAYTAANCQTGVMVTNNATTAPCYSGAIFASTTTPKFNGSCLSVSGQRKGTTPAASRPHHIDILEVSAQNCSSSGISVIEADYVRVAYNTVWNCGFYSADGVSGIDFLNMWNSVKDGGLPVDNNFDGFAGYNVVVDQNKVFNTQELVGWNGYLKNGKPVITDGEGIILDTFQNASVTDGVPLTPFTGKTLVSNNLSFDNGSAGIEVFNTYNVDVLNNSTYGNSLNNVMTADNNPASNQYKNGEINILGSHGLNVENNLFQPSNSAQVIVNNRGDCQCWFTYNDLYTGTSVGLSSQNEPTPNTNIVTNPQYVTVSTTNFWSVSLQLNSSSAARGAGEVWLLPRTAYGGGAREVNGKTDMGAYQQ